MPIDIDKIIPELQKHYGEEGLQKRIDIIYNNHFKGKYSFEHSKKTILLGLYKRMGDSTPSRIIKE